ncbi:hypothetical protein [Secundilactobacillus collinoides]|uniref:Uncharacterized protein n=2 Tax=Secundilactobacillus collinoides TaxID=33960 RepID=A0A0R2BD39_SECCO|nr:hypothetical protein [Secundilactobacillus collinoides]KRM76661.1 hypothetical protein FC82_GL001142 [Secundilactobacillus collinoides DSM 20515 = JCM 1123]
MMKKQLHGLALFRVCCIAIVIVFCIISLIKLPEILFGNVTGWLPVVMLSLYVAIAMPQGMNYSLLMECLFGTIYGMIMGTVFSIFMPGIAIGFWLLLSCRLSGHFPVVMNDYGLTIATVFAIPGVAGLNHMMMAVPTFIVGAIIVTVLTVVIVQHRTKKAVVTTQHPVSGR